MTLCFLNKKKASAVMHKKVANKILKLEYQANKEILFFNFLLSIA